MLQKDILEALEKKIKDTTYKQLKEAIENYLNAITFKKEEEYIKIDNINLNNYLSIYRTNLNILNLATNNKNIEAPIKPIEAIENYNRYLNKYNSLFGDTKELYYYDNLQYIGNLENTINSYKNKLQEYNNIINTIEAKIDTYILPTIEVKEFNYNKEYEEFKKGNIEKCIKDF